MDSKEKILERIKYLTTEIHNEVMGTLYDLDGLRRVRMPIYLSFTASSLEIIKSLFGDKSHYYTSLSKIIFIDKLECKVINIMLINEVL